MNRNFKLEFEKTIEQIKASGKIPRLLLHSCCAPCSTFVLKTLADYFDITILYYNPNIFPEHEYQKRLGEQKRLLTMINPPRPIKLVEGRYNSDNFLALVKGHENEYEGRERCSICFKMRLEEAAKYAKQGGYDYFTTTLTVSRYKNSAVINTIAEQVAEKYGVPHLTSDFKKNNGSALSNAMAKEYGLYMQHFCGCPYSKDYPY